MPEFQSQEIEEFVRSTLQGIEKGMLKEKGLLKDYELRGDIDFELAVVNIARAEGGIRLFVVDAKGKTSNENVSKIRFKISEKMQVERAFLRT